MAWRRGDKFNGPHRVVITGAGIVTSMGHGWEVNAGGFRSGRVALRPVTVFDTSRQRVHSGGEVVMDAPLPETRLTGRQLGRLDRATTLLLHAGMEAARQAAWHDTEGESIPISLGTSAGAMALGEKYFRSKSCHPAQKKALAGLVTGYLPHTQAQLLADATGISGPVSIIANACASGANAIGHAFHLVKWGRARRAFCGGYDAIAELVFAGFDSLQALSTTTPRPFDATRDGLALGEGAAMLTLERLDDALARGATILGEAAGYGASTDLHHLTQPHPQGDAALRSMTEACAEAGVQPGEIGYLNSHGTGTPLNDAAEGLAIQRWAGDAVARVRVSSTKGSIGHLLGGAGAVEAVICLMAMRGGWLPPNVPVAQPDPVCTFDLVQSPRDAQLDCTLTNSFGFGGANATLVFRRYKA
ncbi:MAG: beta-ketoacyl-[acyl-carrier-protein] synthase family protein [Verrucomicrobiaceae bacterium]|nr:beta-ketoacyl-[acyl-carrier-protein] synthase family protein [Verrucomicrobiaceae bacterium]